MAFFPFHVDTAKATRGFVHNRARRIIAQFCDGIGPQRFERLIVTGTPLQSVMPQEVTWGEQTVTMEQAVRLASGWGWVGNAITDEEFATLLPPWLQESIAKHGEKGQVWLAGLIYTLRGILMGKVPQTAPPPQQAAGRTIIRLKE